MESYYKLRKDLSIEHFGKKLFRIEATHDIECQDVKKGDLGGYIEKKENLFGNAWVSGDAQISDDARIYGNARIFGSAQISGNARIFGSAQIFGSARISGDEVKTSKDVYNITSNSQYDITILPKYIQIGCEFHKKEEWFKFTDKQIFLMNGKNGLIWWKQWRPILKAICKIT